MSSTSQLKERINMILDTERNNSTRLARIRTGALAAVALIMTAAFGFHSGPRLALALEAEAAENSRKEAAESVSSSGLEADGEDKLQMPEKLLRQSGNYHGIEVWSKKTKWQQEREPANYKAFIAKFIDIFNSGNLSEILNHTSTSLLDDTDPERVVGFLDLFKTENGKIEVMRFKYFDKRNQQRNQQDLALYYLEFENRTQWDFRVGVNDSLQMTRFIITDNNYNEDLPFTKSKTPLSLPFQKGEEWFVLWGGDTEDDNYHVTSRSQKNAVDFIIRHPWSKKSYKTNGEANEDYYAFGKPVFSPCDGEVVTVINGIEDNSIGKMNSKDLTGNTVIIKSNKPEYILLAHFKNNSIAVSKNDRIKTGDLLGLCGNSGNSSEPHLHMHVMDSPILQGSTGIKMYIEELILNGESYTMNYSPVRGNTVMRK